MRNKLFIYGEDSGNPEDWEYGGFTLVIAKNKRSAAKILDASDEICIDMKIHEVDFSKELRFHWFPAWWEGLSE